MKFFRYISVLLSAAVLTGCLGDRADGCDPANGQIVIQIKTPESFASRSQTRALSEEKEMDIRTLDILVFEDKGGSETFMYHVVPTYSGSPSDLSVKYFTATLQTSKNSEKQRLVLLANIPDDCRSKLSVITEGMAKQDALDLLVFGSGGVWTAGDLPMWGESDRSVVVTERTTGGAFGTIRMLYSMARIDVGLNANNDWTAFQGLPGYSISEVHLINTNKAGYMAPHKADLAAGLPTIPSAAEGNDALGFQAFATGGYSPGHPNYLPPTGAMHLIYASEYANKGKTFENVSYLVVKVHYDNGTTVSDSWYRIDFYDRNLTEIMRLDLLRGHLYMVNIKGVDGPGYPTLEQAQSSITTLINAEVTVWNEKGIVTELGSAVKDEKYILEVSQAEFSFNGIQRTDYDTNNKVDILTDYSGGWRVSAVTEVTEGSENENPYWLYLSSMGGSPGYHHTVSINVGEYDSTVPRYGRIYIEAGKWTYVINVMQKLGTLSVSPERIDLTFDHYQVPLAEARLTMETEFGWMLDRIEYSPEQEEDPDFKPWLSVFDPDLDLSKRDPFDLFRKEFDLRENDGDDDLELRNSKNAYLRVDANPMSKSRTATVYFMNEEGLEASVEVSQGWIKCGVGGVPKIRQIGGKKYATHIYGTNIRKIGESMAEMGYFKRMSALFGNPNLEKEAINYIQSIPNEYAISCFMVENSEEGDWSYWNYKNSPTTTVDCPKGPYYLYENAVGACPPGWRLPTELDGNNINIPSEALRDYGLHYYTPDYQLLATPQTYTGYGWYNYSNSEWYNAGSNTYFHGALYNNNGYEYEACIYVYREGNSPAGTHVSRSSWSYSNNTLMPVRCVEDVNPYDYPMFD